GLVTNDVKKLTPGHGCHAAFLTPKGKLLADLVILCLPDGLVVDTEPELAAKLDGLFRKYLIFQEVSIVDQTAGTAVIHVAGDRASEALESIGLPIPAAPHDVLETTFSGAGALVVNEPRTGGAGFDVRLPGEPATALVQALGLTPSPASLLE